MAFHKFIKLILMQGNVGVMINLPIFQLYIKKAISFKKKMLLKYQFQWDHLLITFPLLIKMLLLGKKNNL